MVKRFGRHVVALLVCWQFPVAANTTLHLVAEEHEVFVAAPPQTALFSEIVATAFDRMDVTLTLEVMRPAFMKSALTSGRVSGEFSAIDLMPRREGYIYSEPYFMLELMVASRDDAAGSIKVMDDLDSQRVAVVNRYANTPVLRDFKRVSWSRNPNAFDALRQIADKRTPFLLASKLYLNEINALLADNQRNPMRLSDNTLITTGIRLSLRLDVPDAEKIIARFNREIVLMRQQAVFNKILGVQWLLADINSDGRAEWLSTSDSDVLTISDKPSFPHYLRLDDSQLSNEMEVYLDGVATQQRLTYLTSPTSSQRGNRSIKLNQAQYRRLLRDW